MASRNQSQINLTGFRGLEAALLKLPAELAKTVEADVLRGGMTPVRKAAQTYAKRIRDTGQLYKSIGLTVRRVRKKGQNVNRYTARVGPRGGFGITLGTKTKGKNKGKSIRRDPRFYAHLIEYGTSRQPARPFIRPALASSESAIIAGMAKGYEKGMAKVVRKIRSNK
jgi:HK97 gp10 family phage protein